MADPQRIYTCYEVTGRRSGRASSRSTRGSRSRRRRGSASRRYAVALVALTVIALVIGGVLAWQQTALPGFVLERVYPLHYEEAIASAADRYGVDPYLVAAVARAESNFDPQAVSKAGAVGIMQLMPETAEWLTGRPGWRGSGSTDLRDPVDSIELGAFYLAFLLERFDGDRAATLAAYNAGHNAVTRWLDEEAVRAEREGATADGLGDIPFPETRGFVDRVERYHQIYLEGHPGAFAGVGD